MKRFPFTSKLLFTVFYSSLCLLLFAGNIFAKPDDKKTEKRNYETARINQTAPIIDGMIDEDVWEQVEWTGDFIQLSPYENKPPSQQTQFKVLYNDDNIYFALRCFDTAPDSIVKRMSRRDGFDGDWIEVNIDSYHDLRTAFSFTVNAAGVKGDEAVTDDSNWDSSWDPIWYVKTNIDDQGWTAEFRIPLSQLRFGKKDFYTWGLQVNRRLFRKQERSSWQFISPNASGWVHHFGELHGIQNIKPQKQKDLTPYTVVQAETYQREIDNPYATGKDFNAKIGLDGKFGVTNDLTLDFTINPDFGQIEADPSEVNLTTYETYFRERRPFFIEGKDILSLWLTAGNSPLSRDNLFYSRRIGRNPGYSPEINDGEHIDMPKNTTILGAFKLTGKTQKGLSVGVMESFTQREYAEIDHEGEQRSVEVEPFTHYFAGRLQKDFNKSNTRIGGMVTATNRSLGNIDLQNTMHEAAYTGGINFNHEWKDKTYYFNFSTALSQVRGSKEAIYKTQTSSPHFLQREDATHFSADSNRTSLSGHGGNIQVGKAGNGKFMFTLWLTWRSPGFNPNDIGYLRRNDEIMQVFWVGFRQNEPFSIFRNMGLNFNQWVAYTFGGERRYIGGNLNIQWTYKNYWSQGGGVSLEGNSINTNTLRGGPSLRYDGTTNYWTYIDSDSRKKVQFSLSYDANRYENKVAQSDALSLWAKFQITDALQFSLQPRIQKRMDQIEYVSNVDDWDEMRYIRGKIEQTETSLTFRFSYNITPDFTIQYYAMPFISAGSYSEFKYISDSKAEDFNNRYIAYTDEQIVYDEEAEVYNIFETGGAVADYGFDRPDFNYYDLNSSLVVRWEYLPGSTLYLVWTQNRNDHVSTGRYSFMDDVEHLFEIYPHDVFLVKASFRFGL